MEAISSHRVDLLKIMDHCLVNGQKRFVYSLIFVPMVKTGTYEMRAKCSGVNDKPGMAGNCETIVVTTFE